MPSIGNNVNFVKKVDNTEYNNKCKKCGKTFKTWQALSGHMAYCNGEMKECPICKKSVYAMRFNKHYEKCLEREEYFSDKIENIDYVVCKICGCKKLSLKKHLESHNICIKGQESYYFYDNTGLFGTLTIADSIEKAKDYLYNYFSKQNIKVNITI